MFLEYGHFGSQIDSTIGLSLDCGQRLSASAGLCPRRAWSPEWLCVVYCLCFV